MPLEFEQVRGLFGKKNDIFAEHFSLDWCHVLSKHICQQSDLRDMHKAPMCSAALPCEESWTAWQICSCLQWPLPLALDGLCCVSHTCILPLGIWERFFLGARVSGLVPDWDPSPSPRTAGAGCDQGLYQQTSHRCSMGLREIEVSDCSYFSDVLLLYESWQPVCKKCLQYISVNTWCIIIIFLYAFLSSSSEGCLSSFYSALPRSRHWNWFV